MQDKEKYSFLSDTHSDSFGHIRRIYKVFFDNVLFGYIYPVKFFGSKSAYNLKNYGIARNVQNGHFWGDQEYFDKLDEAKDYIKNNWQLLKNGGVLASEVNANSTIVSRAKASDLIILPENVQGTNCSNCKFVEIKDAEKGLGYCNNKNVDQDVTARMCCIYWDAHGTKRVWERVEKNEKLEQGGEIKSELSGGIKASGYEERVISNMRHMGTPLSDWSAIPIKGFETVEGQGGKDISLPVFDFESTKGYVNANSLFAISAGSSTANCELCGKDPIKRVFWIKNDKEKLTLRVGSECVKYVGDGKSGAENLREAKITLAKMLDNDLINLSGIVARKYKSIRTGGYGRKEVVWSNSYVGPDGGTDYFQRLHNQIKLLNPIELFDLKKSNKFNKDYIYWRYVCGKIPVFGWEYNLKNIGRYGWLEDTLKSRLLSWFTRNKELGVKMITQVIAVMKLIGDFEGVEYISDYIESLDKKLADD